MYLKGEKVTDDVDVPLLLNGQSFTGIEGLNRNVDYTYDEQSATVTLKAQYLDALRGKVRSAREADHAWGRAADLVFHFSGGADWHEYVVVAGAPSVAESASVSASATAGHGTKAEGLKIPMSFNGGEVRNVVAMEGGKRVGPNSSWWGYLQNGGAFSVSYESADRVTGTLNLLPVFFADSSVIDGDITLTVTLQDGQILLVTVNVTGDEVTLKK
ncbi:X2-like carbohydrate binding domain-containing protein [Alloscardovia macacae]|uniref:X2-like carbohydrate binding domain-containing protein n=1 Tax=Alloscardovia macacae TaxID=1160091 RepID=UPI00214D4726|nr:X2-like carbohydrate binding domain-containing protein [Alloscardovia macacae]